jgi:hypothetical protein
MTTRERWTVYPLLFLAIGLAMRAQSGAPDLDGRVRVEVLDAASVICRELRVESADGPTLVHLGRVKGGGGGRIEIRDAKGNDSVAVGTRPGRSEGGVEFFDFDGAESARLTAAGLDEPPPDHPTPDATPADEAASSEAAGAGT